jgi:ABC-type transport system substrate-binding protein
MTNIILGIAIAAASLTACNNNNAADTKTTEVTKDTPAVVAEQKAPDTTITPVTATFPVKEIIAGYLQLKNALAKDNGKDAATAGNAIVATLATVDMKSLSATQMKSYMDIADDLKEHAEHIGANAGKIEHQREHFVMLSKDVADLIKTFGNGGPTLYKDFCPMANNGKGAIWISELKEIKNPYYGKSMSTCGSVKETLK